MGDTLKIGDELKRFFGRVPSEAASPNAFHGEQLAGSMPGVQTAATMHAMKLNDAEKYVTQANDGFAAYKDAATTIDRAYDTTDQRNGADLDALNGQTLGRLMANSGPSDIQGNMPSIGALNPLDRAGDRAPIAVRAPSGSDVPDLPTDVTNQMPTPWVAPPADTGPAEPTLLGP